MININDLTVYYDDKLALSDISINTDKASFISIVGPNGSGKTTLLKAVHSLVEYKGDVYIGETNTKSLGKKEMSKRIALFAQSNSTYFPFTVYDTILQGRFPFSNSLFGYSKEDKRIVEDMIIELDLLEFKDRLISTLSGGELQRVFLARTLVQNPEVLLLDEPTNHLDLSYQVEILDYIKNWSKKNNKLVIAVLHDLNMVQQYADEVLLLDQGKLVQYGKKEQVLGSNNLSEVYKFNVKDWSQDVLRRWLLC